MDKEMIHDSQGAIDNKNIWYDTEDPDFVDISLKSMVNRSWLSYKKVLEGKYQDSIIKPLSNYVQNIATPPSLVSIEGSKVKLRFHLYADMYLLKEEGKDLYHVDRPWMRQYYNTKHTMPEREDCFEGTYKFFVPWFVDANLEVSYLQPDVESAFIVEETKDFWYKPPTDALFLHPHFVMFKFKKIGSHMEDAELGIPRRGSPTFDMEFSGDDIMVERIKEFYANN